MRIRQRIDEACVLVFLLCLSNNKVIVTDYKSATSGSSLCYASFRMTGFCFLLTIRNLYYWGDFFESQRFFFLNCFFKWAKLAKFIRDEAMWWRMKDARCEYFNHEVHGDVVKWLRFWELWGTSEMFWESHGYSVGRCRKTFSLMKRFFTTLCLVQNDRVLFFAHD